MYSRSLTMGEAADIICLEELTTLALAPPAIILTNTLLLLKSTGIRYQINTHRTSRIRP